MQPKIMLITGGAGFIGSNFIRYVQKHDPQICIINLDKLTYAGSLNNLKGLSNSHHFIQGDINDSELVKSLLRKYEVDTIVHFAAESHVDRSIHTPAAFVDTNLQGTFTLLEAARQYWLCENNFSSTECRFHHVSTDEVYGSLNVRDNLSDEDTAYAPRSPYSATKAGSDHLVNAYFHTYGLPVTLSHCSNNYGPYQHSEKFIPTIILACLHLKPVPIYGNGKNIRDWLYVEDHCRGIMKIITQEKIGHRYNLAGNNQWENIQIAQYICQQLDNLYPRPQSYSSLLQFVPDRQGHDFRYGLSTEKIQNELGWEPQETFESGMRKTLDFYWK